MIFSQSIGVGRFWGLCRSLISVPIRSEEAGVFIYHFSSHQWLELLSEIWFHGKAEAGIASGIENAEMIGHIERALT